MVVSVNGSLGGHCESYQAGERRAGGDAHNTGPHILDEIEGSESGILHPFTNTYPVQNATLG